MDRVVFIHNTLRDFVSHFAFGVVDDNIIIRHQKGICDFTLCRETFAGAGSTEDKSIRIFQLFSVHHNQIVGESIQTVVQRFFAGLVKLLCGEWNENGRTAGSKAALNLNLIIGQRQRGHKPLFLLVIQAAQIAVVLLCDGACLKDIVFQFLFGTPGVQHEECHQKHSLVLALQFFQQGFGITAIGRQIGRNDVNIIPGADCFLLLLNLASIKFSNRALDRFNGAVLVNALNA